MRFSFVYYIGDLPVSVLAQYWPARSVTFHDPAEEEMIEILSATVGGHELPIETLYVRRYSLLELISDEAIIIAHRDLEEGSDDAAYDCWREQEDMREYVP